MKRDMFLKQAKKDVSKKSACTAGTSCSYVVHGFVGTF